jgi:hypothetical protein
MVARTGGLHKLGIAERTRPTMNSWKGSKLVIPICAVRHAFSWEKREAFEAFAAQIESILSAR